MRPRQVRTQLEIRYSGSRPPCTTLPPLHLLFRAVLTFCFQFISVLLLECGLHVGRGISALLLVPQWDAQCLAQSECSERVAA